MSFKSHVFSMRDLSFFSSGTNVRTDVIHAAKPRYRGLAARHASKYVNMNVKKSVLFLFDVAILGLLHAHVRRQRART